MTAFAHFRQQIKMERNFLLQNFFLR